MKPSPNGFTLIEMMIVVAIIGVLSAMSVWAMNSFTANMKVSADANTLASFIRSARLKTYAQGCPHVVQLTIPAAGTTTRARMTLYRKGSCTLTAANQLLRVNNSPPIAGTPNDIVSSSEEVQTGALLSVTNGAGTNLAGSEIYVGMFGADGNALFGNAPIAGTTVTAAGPGQLTLSNPSQKSTAFSVEVRNNGSVQVR
jgi:prepilin-type N-terminal cleavage/methylation domain-containing protein